MAKKKKKQKGSEGKAPVPVAQEEKKSFSFAKVRPFIDDVKREFGKIQWPDKNVTLRTTGVVIVLVLLVSLYLGAVDFVLGKLISYILGS
ncbi:MAG: preprotein translocase subunit SecE [Thermodesulfobacteriota bacterium]